MLYGTRKALNALNGHLLNAYKYEVLMRSKVKNLQPILTTLNEYQLAETLFKSTQKLHLHQSSLHCCCNILVRLSLNFKRNITVCDYSFQEAIVILLELITLSCKELE